MTRTQDETQRRTLNLLAPINHATLFEQTHFVTITCRVCLLPSKIPIDENARLCRSCRADLVITRNSLEYQLNALDTRTRAAYEAFEALKESCQDEATLDRWRRAEAAGVAPHSAFKASWAARTTEPTPLAALLRAWATFEQECSQIATHRDKVTAALAEVEQAERAV